MKINLELILGTSFIIGFFIALSYFVQSNLGFVQENLKNSILGAFLYSFAFFLAVVIAPISAIPLLPIAAKIWGVFPATVLSITGLTSGSTVAFMISQKYGSIVAKKFFSQKQIDKIEKKFIGDNYLWKILFMRMILPAELLSYVLGISKKIELKKFVVATTIGMIPPPF
ncbi:MAG: VTT domain-containing protein [Nanoarchaeota archaeon]|nr:VTT domain-containing protein [Nanoarchaeota archaeon]